MKKKILATFLSAVTLVSCSSALAANYSDVNQSAWYSSYVNKISELNAFSVSGALGLFHILIKHLSLA